VYGRTTYSELVGRIRSEATIRHQSKHRCREHVPSVLSFLRLRRECFRAGVRPAAALLSLLRQYPVGAQEKLSKERRPDETAPLRASGRHGRARTRPLRGLKQTVPDCPVPAYGARRFRRDWGALWLAAVMVFPVLPHPNLSTHLATWTPSPARRGA